MPKAKGRNKLRPLVIGKWNSVLFELVRTWKWLTMDNRPSLHRPSVLRARPFTHRDVCPQRIPMVMPGLYFVASRFGTRPLPIGSRIQYILLPKRFCLLFLFLPFLRIKSKKADDGVPVETAVRMMPESSGQACFPGVMSHVGNDGVQVFSVANNAGVKAFLEYGIIHIVRITNRIAIIRFDAVHYIGYCIPPSAGRRARAPIF